MEHAHELPKAVPRSLMFFVITLVAIVQPLRAQLQVIDYTLPITTKTGSDMTVVGNVPLGTPLRIQLTYDPRMGGGPSSEPGENIFVFFNDPATTHASFTIGDFTGEMTPNISLAMSPFGFAVADRLIPSDQYSYFATTTMPSASYMNLRAAFVYPSGTIDGSALFPTIVPSIVDFAVIIHESDGVEVRFDGRVFPNGPFGAIPEPETYGAIGAGLLVGLLIWRSVVRGRLRALSALTGVVATHSA